MTGPLHSSSGHNAAAGGKTIEEMYQKKTQLEHILLRPDTYVGSVEKHTQTLWVYEGGAMVNRPVTYVPGLYKIFDEILVNAADNKQRDPRMNSLKVEIDVEGCCVSVYNNGDGIPVEVHQEEGVYVPELIFGHLLTSSNYNDNEKKTTGGRNGYGAKLTNIFSTEFVIETADGHRLKKYKQVFSENMGKKSEPQITKCKQGENWTRVTFKPDLAKFNMTHLEDDVVALMRKRVVDMAGTLGKTVKVEMDGEKLPVKSFSDYVDMYIKSVDGDPKQRIFKQINERWEVCVTPSEGQFQQVSFVNGIATVRGGTHVDYVTNQVANYVMSIVNKKKKNANMKLHNVKNHLWVFVNALIDNPAFDSQTKETLTTRQGSFGSKCELPIDFLKGVEKNGIVSNVLSWAEFKLSKELKKTDGSKKSRISGLTKLEDANEAGGKDSDKCTLILTEGDSAKALAMSGIAVVGRDHYGVFPLRGKLLNVREANHKQIMENAEIQNIKQILGLQHGKQYDSTKGLRYGHLMIMTDQDHDGSHIKGLLINFIHSFWPSLLKVKSFMVEFITPIIKATKRNDTISFFTMPEYEEWKRNLGAHASSWTIKYYKGLGTSTAAEGKDYFTNIDRHQKDFVWVDDQDGNEIELAFSKKRIADRKEWLTNFQPGTYLDQREKEIKYRDFINKELILFSMADLQRSIPSMVDGFKPGQRKILFCSFKRNLVKETKVAQFSGYVSEHSAYHHGEQSLASTIVGMAQSFVGSNNINLLYPGGQFGTRFQGGKDAASPRYIFTKLSHITRSIFPKDDDILLNYLNEDGQSIEPSWYMPILPMVLVNGSEGIGTGWSTYIPNYNPRDIVANIRRLLNGQPTVPMHPWYRGFKGSIEKTNNARVSGATYTITGVIEAVNSTTLRITELPVRRWTEAYKEFLETLLPDSKNKDKEAFIEDYTTQGDNEEVYFEVILTEQNMNIAKEEGLVKKFKLTTTIGTSNMHLFDSDGKIRKYDTPEQILDDFYKLRLEFYFKRKEAVLQNMKLDLKKLANKVRFIRCVVNNEIVVSNRKRADLFLELRQKNFDPFPKKKKTAEPAAVGAIEEEEVEESPEAANEVDASDYEYLLSMAIGTLTLEKMQELNAQKDKVVNEIEELQNTSEKSLWLRDLDTFEKDLEVLDQKDLADAEERRRVWEKNAKKGGSKAAPKKQRKKPAAKQPKVESDTEGDADEQVVTKRGAPQKKPAKSNGAGSDDEDYVAGKAKKEQQKKKQSKKASAPHVDEDCGEVPALKDRIANMNLSDSSPGNSAMETETAEEQVGEGHTCPPGAASSRASRLAPAAMMALTERLPQLEKTKALRARAPLSRKAVAALCVTSFVAGLLLSGRVSLMSADASRDDGAEESLRASGCAGNKRKLGESHPKDLLNEVSRTHQAIQSLDKAVSTLEMELAVGRARSSAAGAGTAVASKPPQKAFVVIGINTAFSSRKRRDSLRDTWVPRGEKLRRLETEKGIVIRFVIGHSGAPGGGAMDRALDKEEAETRDFLRLDHAEGYHELSSKTRIYFTTAVATWDADFYVKVDDDVHLNLGMLSSRLAKHRTRPRVYVGCMKSGPVLSQKGVKYHEPEYWKFGDEGNKYFRHATGQIYAISKDLAAYISINQPILHRFANEDVSLGAWLIGLEVEHVDDRSMCCATPPDCEWKKRAGNVCVASFDWSCSGVCKSVDRMRHIHKDCGEGEGAVWNVAI